jgi:hypothetical protein
MLWTTADHDHAVTKQVQIHMHDLPLAAVHEVLCESGCEVDRLLLLRMQVDGLKHLAPADAWHKA